MKSNVQITNLAEFKRICDEECKQYPLTALTLQEVIDEIVEQVKFQIGDYGTCDQEIQVSILSDWDKVYCFHVKECIYTLLKGIQTLKVEYTGTRK